MHVAHRSYLTAGIAALGAGAIALTPVQPVPTHLAAAQERTVSTLSVNLVSTIDPITPDPDYQIPTPYTRDLSAGVAQSPGSAPVTHIDGSLKADSEFLTIEFSNGGVADAWFQLIEVAVWGKAKMHTP